MSLISVYMVVYNEELFVGEAIDSILNQTYKDFEFVILDDGSTDRTPDILARCKDKRVKVHHQKNIGRPKARNLAVKLTKGNYIAVLDADDVSLPTRLEKECEFLESNKKVALVGSAYNDIDEQGNILRTVYYPTTDEELRKEMVKYNPFFHSSVMFRREVLDHVGYYDENFKYSQDYEFFSRIAMKYKIANLSEVLGNRRIHKKNLKYKNRQAITFDYLAHLRAIQRLSNSKFDYIYLFKSLIKYVLPLEVYHTIKWKVFKFIKFYYN